MHLQIFELLKILMLFFLICLTVRWFNFINILRTLENLHMWFNFVTNVFLLEILHVENIEVLHVIIYNTDKEIIMLWPGRFLYFFIFFFFQIKIIALS